MTHFRARIAPNVLLSLEFQLNKDRVKNKVIKTLKTSINFNTKFRIHKTNEQITIEFRIKIDISKF